MEKFKDLVYQRPDVEALKQHVGREIRALREAKSYDEAKRAYLAIDDLEGAFMTSYTLASIRSTLDTRDEFYEGEMAYLDKHVAMLSPLLKKVGQALLANPFREDFVAEYGEHLFKMTELALRIQSNLNIPALIRESQLEAKYRKVAASCRTTFRGEEVNLYGLLKHMESPDRQERKEAFEAWAAQYERISDELDALYDKLVRLRVGMAKRLKLGSYIELAYYGKSRMDYTAKEVESFRKQVREVIVPAVAKYRKRQAARIGVEKLKYYDEGFIFPEGNADPVGGQDVLVPIATRMYRALSPETAEFFDFMVEHELFDLETRPGKHLGGYCTFLADYKAPFIFSNFNGTAADIGVLTHEAGHAFQAYTGSRCAPFAAYAHSTSEINEIHSMAMEHFTYPWLKDFVGAENEQKARYAHLMDAIAVIPYMCCVDEFQHRVFEKPEMTASERRAVWRELEKTYTPWRDFDGNTFLEGGGFWMQKQHIFLYPFYYIDYALAQTCVFELYGRMKKDNNQAWADYLRLCRAGGSVGYFDLLKIANLTNPFTEGAVQNALGHVFAELDGMGF